MSRKKQIAILGCGIFGAMIALRLSENGFGVTVFEKELECLRGASFNNQNRLHLGFHYPRDVQTAKQCVRGFSRFCEEFSECIVSGFPNLSFGIITTSCKSIIFESGVLFEAGGGGIDPSLLVESIL